MTEMRPNQALALTAVKKSWSMLASWSAFRGDDIVADVEAALDEKDLKIRTGLDAIFDFIVEVKEGNR